MYIYIIQIITGIIFLYVGSEILIKKTEKLAFHLKISPIVIGLTIISISTSIPEMSTSIVAQINNSPNIIIGTLIGSNIANIALILGLIFAFAPYNIPSIIKKRDIPFLLISTIFLTLAMLKNQITRLEGFLLLIIYIFMTYCQIYLQKKHQEKGKEQHHRKAKISHILIQTFFVFISLAIVLIGAHYLIKGSTSISHYFGISNRLISLTLIAIGTSLPELTISILSAIRKKVSISISTIIGSNIVNSLFVMGGIALISPITFSSKFYIDLLIMIFFTLILWITCFFKKEFLLRIVGVSYLLLYLIYIFFIFS